MAYADVTYVGHKYEDAAREEEGKQVRALGKKGVRVVRDSLRELYTLNRGRLFYWIQSQSRRYLTSPTEYLTIIPRARMGSEPIAAKWAIDSEAMRARGIILLVKSN